MSGKLNEIYNEIKNDPGNLKYSNKAGYQFIQLVNNLK